ncbi:MAG: alpha-mannosidase [Clostridia bacterium]|nr:alpha-mannosidase [Clostridia bacterium]MBQ7380447.1 alpha-mannosidase [Clostridia bacterium]
MIPYNELQWLQKFLGSSQYAARIVSQLNYAANLSRALDGKYDETVKDAILWLCEAIRGDGEVLTKASALQAEQMLMPLSKDAKTYRVHSVAHAHIDMNWMWGYQETVAVTVDTFRTVLNLMKEYPQLTFGQSQASTYEIVEKYAPYMLDEIKQRIREGRWEVTASTWVETDKNMASGESLARHILYTRRYLSALLELPTSAFDFDFEPDTFGHNISVPEICAAGGVKYYYHCRGNGTQGQNAYVWRSRAGGELLVYREPHWYNTTIEENMMWDIPMQCKAQGANIILNVYGVGDHGGGPTRRDVERLMRMSSWPIMPTILFSTYAAFFAELEQYRSTLPVVEGELNFLFDGCYTSQSRIKMANRIGEARAFEAEAICTEAAMLGGMDFAGSFREAWKGILFNHFHDILPGSGVPETREHTMGKFQDSLAYIGTNANAGMRYIASCIDTTGIELPDEPDSISEGGGVGHNTSPTNYYRMPATERGMGMRRLVHFFNPTQYDFDGTTDCTIYDWSYNIATARWSTPDGQVTEHQFIQDGTWYWGHTFCKFAVHVKVPAFGFASYILDCAPEQGKDVVPLMYERTDTHARDEIVLENRYIKAVFDCRTAELTSLTDKESGSVLVDSSSAYFRHITESTIRNMTSWRVGDYMKVENIQQSANVRINRTDTTNRCKLISYYLDFAERSHLEVQIRLDEDSRFLQYEVTVDFHEIGIPGKSVPQLNFALPFSYASEKCRFDVPFGTVDRARYNYDVPASSFAVPLGDKGAALMLISDSKYGFRYTEGMIALSLVRGSYDPDPCPEYGIHRIRIGVGVCHPDKGDRELYRMADAFVHPISYCTADLGKREGTIKLCEQMLRVQGEMRVTALKTSEQGKAFVVRMHNVGAEPTDWSLTFAQPIKAAYYTDVHESIIGDVAFNGNSASGTSAPYAICTVLVELA